MMTYSELGKAGSHSHFGICSCLSYFAMWSLSEIEKGGFGAKIWIEAEMLGLSSYVCLAKES